MYVQSKPNSVNQGFLIQETEAASVWPCVLFTTIIVRDDCWP